MRTDLYMIIDIGVLGRLPAIQGRWTFCLLIGKIPSRHRAAAPNQEMVVLDPKKSQAGKRSDGSRGVQKRIPRDWHEIQGLDPQTGSKNCPLYVDDRTMDLAARKGRGAALELAELVPNTVQGNWFASAWKGVTDYDTEEGDEAWTVYVSTPPYAYDHKRAIKVDPWEGEVFMVFADGDGLIRWYGWGKADPNNPKLPIDHDQHRFGRQLL